MYFCVGDRVLFGFVTMVICSKTLGLRIPLGVCI